MGKYEFVSTTNLGDVAFVEDFIKFGKEVRDETYRSFLPSDDHTMKLMKLAVATGSCLWLVRDHSQRTVLRFSTRVHADKKDTGALGFFEIAADHADLERIIELAEAQIRNWFRARSVTSIAGPIDVSTWFNYRFSVPGKRFFPRYKWEPTTPPTYLEIFRTLGFRDFAYFHTVFFPHLRIGDFCLGTGAMKRSYKNLWNRGFMLRAFDAENFMEKEVPLFHEISHEVFKDALLFEPIDLQSFKAIYAAAAKSYDFSPSSVLISSSGEVAGFIFAFYDGDFLVIKSIAIRQKFQGLNLSSGMIYHAVKQSFVKKKKGTISALVRAGLPSESIEANAQRTTWFSWKHHYVLLKKDLL